MMNDIMNTQNSIQELRNPKQDIETKTCPPRRHVRSTSKTSNTVLPKDGMSPSLCTPCLRHCLLTLLSGIDNHQCILCREQCRILKILDQHHVREYFVDLSFVNRMRRALTPGCMNKHGIVIQRKDDLCSVRGKLQMCLIFGGIPSCFVQSDTVRLGCFSHRGFVCVGSARQSCRWSPFVYIHDFGCCAQRFKLQLCF